MAGSPVRCPSCGATNPDGASWCSLCYARLGQPAEAPPATPGPSPAEPEAADGAAAAGFKRVDGELVWECVTCGQDNPIELTACSVCATTFAARFAVGDEEPPRDWRTALWLSALLPGVGHYLVGRGGQGVARGLLYSVWLAGGALFAFGGAGLVLAGPLLLGAVIIWAGSLVDLLRLQQGEEPLLNGRVLLWVVVTVTAALILGVVFGAAGLPRTPEVRPA